MSCGRFRLAIVAIFCACAGLGFDEPLTPQIPPPFSGDLPEPLATDSGEPSAEQRLLDRVDQLEATIERLNLQVEQLQVQVGQGPSVSGGPSVVDAPGRPGPIAPPSAHLPGRSEGELRPITDILNYAPFATGASPGANMPAMPRSAGLRGVFGKGFQFASEDEEYLLQVNQITMADGQVNTPRDQALVEDGIGLPLALLIFSGRITRMIEYEATFGNAFTLPNPNTFKMVFFYADVRLDDRLVFRIGQQRVPYTYEYYYSPFSGLINLDWSLFFHNFSPLAAPGINVMGQLFDKRLDYSAGIYDAPLIGSGLGNPISHGNVHGTKSVFGLVNTRPFLHSGRERLEGLNLGGSFFAGDQRGDSLPRPLVAGLPSFGVPFLLFEPDARLSGLTAAWAASMGYYYRQLSVLAEYEAGIQNLAAPGVPGLTNSAPQSFYVQAGYMLTGETVVGRGMVEPLRPIDPRRGRFGIGAWELAARYNALSLDPTIFRRGLANPNLWTGDVETIDLGLNWYWNEYIKVSFGWKHIDFGSPVFRNPARLQSTADQWTLRFLFTF